MLVMKENTPNIVQKKTNLIVFKLNGIDYAITVEAIQQIIEMVTIVPVLSTREWMEGVINYHGVSVPVVNLRRHFGMEVVPYRWHTPIILVNILDRLVGLIVDEVLDVLAIPNEQIVDSGAILPPGAPQVSLLKSIIQAEHNITLLLDLVHLFDQMQVRTLSAAVNLLNKKMTQETPAQETETSKPKGKSARKPEKTTAAKQDEIQ